MALSRAFAIALSGIDGQPVEVECDISTGLPGLSFTGLPDASVIESRDRLRAAVVNSGVEWPNRRITVALLPADVRKVGSRFDLAVGVAVLAAAGQVPADPVDGVVWLAELGLDGRLRPVRGVLPAVLAAKRHGFTRVVVARANQGEAALIPDLDVRCAGHLSEIVAWLTGAGPALDRAEARPSGAETPDATDLADVAGQQAAKRALEIAAAGGHHIYLIGTPGAGKTMLAERLPGILPPLDQAASLEVTGVHSVAGLLSEHARLVHRPPWQAPHHTASIAALVGGGSYLARPGAISLAHHGVLFLDEAPEFPPRALDALRQPLETGRVVLQRSGGAVTFPARFQLVLAANPCACGKRALDCICPPATLRRHQTRLSGPLMDRIDLRVQVDPVAHADLFGDADERESTITVAGRVAIARLLARERWRNASWSMNAGVPGATLRADYWLPPRSARQLADSLLERGTLTARGFDRVLRIAWTIADLDGAQSPLREHINEALYFRTGWVESWVA